MRQLFIAARKIILQGANRENQVSAEGQQVVPDRTGQQKARLQIPAIVERYAQHGINGDQQGAKCDSGITLSQTAEQNKSGGRYG